MSILTHFGSASSYLLSKVIRKPNNFWFGRAIGGYERLGRTGDGASNLIAVVFARSAAQLVLRRHSGYVVGALIVLIAVKTMAASS